MAQKMHYFQGLNPLSANPTKLSNTLKEFVSKLATNCLSVLKGMVMQIVKTLITDRLRILKVSWKFRIRDIYDFAVIYP